MKPFFRPSSLLLYFLVFFSMSITGTILSGLMGAGDGQGLAGGAIVLGYGLVTGFCFFMAAIALVAYVSVKTVIKINKIFGILFALCVVFFIIRIYQINGEKDNTMKPEVLRQKTAPVSAPSVKLIYDLNDSQSGFSLGFFRPNFTENSVLYFYPQPSEGKSIDAAMPYDSLSFTRTEHGGFEISYAPSYFFPAYMKMDYDMLLLEMKTLGQDYAEVVVNKVQGRTALVSRFGGQIDFWPTFLLSVANVNLLAEYPQEIRIKPLSHASAIIETEYTFLRPMAVRGDWLKVSLLNTNAVPIDSGWIKWKADSKLAISYDLLM